jgi:hypothetical protein
MEPLDAKEVAHMTPVLFGRIQTRLFLLATVGLVWTLIFTPVLTLLTSAPLGDLYKVTLWALVVTGVVGILWECLYHFLQQFRWEKDWPAMFILLEAIPESFVVFYVVHAIVGFDVPPLAFGVDFYTTWIVVFFAAHGPMRVPFIRWRYRGGRIV